MAPDNPYTPPAAPIVEPVVEVPEDILKKIKNGFIAAMLSGVLTLVVTLYAMSSSAVPGFSSWNLVDVVLIFGLGFGIYKKSRTCAVLMFAYFVVSKIIMKNNASGFFVSMIFLYFYAMCVLGTFQYHEHIKKHTASKGA
jgi:hypothetical protein